LAGSTAVAGSPRTGRTSIVRYDVYKAVSLQIRAIFAAYTPIIEPLSLDEAYLDVTENLKEIASATQIAETIRAKIWRSP
jgi:DNA polymerase IV